MCLSRGMSTPEIRAMRSLSLLLLVLRVVANDHHVAVTADDLALLTALLDRRSDLHRRLHEGSARRDLADVEGKVYRTRSGLVKVTFPRCGRAICRRERARARPGRLAAHECT